MKRFITFILLLLVGFTSLNIKAEENVEMEHFGAHFLYVMNSQITINANYPKDKHDKSELRNELKKIIYKYNFLSDSFAIFNTEEEVSLYEFGMAQIPEEVRIAHVKYINERPNEKIEISKDLYEMLEQAEQIRIDSNGYFDYSIGKIIDVWKDGISNYDKKEMPDEEFDSLLDQVKAIDIIEDPIELTTQDDKYYVMIKEGVKLDLGAFAKGYLTQKIVEYFKGLEIEHYHINSGTSSIAAGTTVDNATYRVQLREPILTTRDAYGEVHIKNQAVTTSGDYEQYFIYKGTRFHHIISPKTKLPSSNYHVLTILGEDAGLMDAASTALFSMSIEEAKLFLEKIGAEGVFYQTDKTIQNLSSSIIIYETVGSGKAIGRYLILGVTIIIIAVAIGIAVHLFKKNKDKIKEDNKLKLIRDVVLFGILILSFGALFLNYHFWPRSEALYADITYQQETYVEVDFRARTAKIVKYQNEDYPKKAVNDNYMEITLLGDFKESGVRQEVVIIIDFIGKRIRVSEEKSPYNLCSKQGWASHGYIICLPNSVTINFRRSIRADGVV